MLRLDGLSEQEVWDQVPDPGKRAQLRALCLTTVEAAERDPLSECSDDKEGHVDLTTNVKIPGAHFGGIHFDSGRLLIRNVSTVAV